jgi:hypothetical protein
MRARPLVTYGNAHPNIGQLLGAYRPYPILNKFYERRCPMVPTKLPNCSESSLPNRCDFASITVGLSAEPEYSDSPAGKPVVSQASASL